MYAGGFIDWVFGLEREERAVEKWRVADVRGMKGCVADMGALPGLRRRGSEAR